jgi:hypothetical protein
MTEKSPIQENYWLESLVPSKESLKIDAKVEKLGVLFLSSIGLKREQTQFKNLDSRGLSNFSEEEWGGIKLSVLAILTYLNDFGYFIDACKTREEREILRKSLEEKHPDIFAVYENNKLRYNNITPAVQALHYLLNIILPRFKFSDERFNSLSAEDLANVSIKSLNVRRGDIWKLQSGTKDQDLPNYIEPGTEDNYSDDVVEKYYRQLDFISFNTEAKLVYIQRFVEILQNTLLCVDLLRGVSNTDLKFSGLMNFLDGVLYVERKPLERLLEKKSA